MQNIFEFVIVDLWNHGCRHHSHGDTGRRKRLDGRQTGTPRCGTGFKYPFQRSIQGGDTDGHGAKTLAGQFSKQVDIAFDERTLRDQRDGLLMVPENLKQLPRVLEPRFRRLIGISVGTDRNHPALVGRV